MLDWIKKLGGKAAGDAPGDLSEEQHLWLAQDLAPLDKLRDELGQRARRYVATGAGAEVLTELADLDGTGARALPLRCNGSFAAMPLGRGELLKSLRSDQAGALHRLGLVWEAASRPKFRQLNMQGEGIPDWLEILLQESTGTAPHVHGGSGPGLVDLDILEEALAAAGQPRDLVARAFLFADPRHYSASSWSLWLLNRVPGWDRRVARWPDRIREALAQKQPERRTQALQLIINSEADPQPFAAEIVELAVGTSKQVREVAAMLVEKISGLVRPLLETKASAGGAEERLHAVTLLARLTPEESEGFLRRRLAEEKSEKVRGAIQEMFAITEVMPATEPAGLEFAVPPLPPVDVETPPGPEIRQALEECYKTAYEGKKRQHELSPAHFAPPEPVPPQQIDAAFDLLRTLTWADPVPGELRLIGTLEIERFLSHPGLRLVHAVRFLFLTNALARKEWRGQLALDRLAVYYSAHVPRFDLRELAAVFRALGLDESNVDSMLLARTAWQTASFAFEPESIWPFFAGRQEALEKALAATDTTAEDRRRNALEVLATFPRAPRRLAPRLWSLALDGTRKERPLAQAALDREPVRGERIVLALASPQAETRAAAADWLGRTGDPAAIPALRTALAKEKKETTAGAMMIALERLGVAPAEIVDLDGLTAEARKGLKKGLPEGLSWLGLENLPAVRWRESGEPVQPEVVQWLLVQNHKLGTPEPGPRLRYLASLFRPEDAEALGRHVLDSWIGQDTLGHPPDEARAYAGQTASQQYQLIQQHPEYFPEHYRRLSLEELERHLYNAKLTEPRGSAIKDKGLLAVAGACGGAWTAAPVERYLKRWYGMRAAHCRALLQMLSWVEHRAAAQLILATAARFRTAGIRKEAEQLVQKLAERKGWTVDQLADRTIPTAGFDERCEMVLDYGGRTFTAKLGEDWSVILTNEEGKAVKALPDPRQGDDEEKAKEAKKILAAARKEIQAILRLQRDRLYEAMCTQRAWPFEDWDEFLHGHPIVRRYCERLVWAVHDGDGDALAATFRPLEDGTLTDAGDGGVTVPPEGTVRLAHSAVLPEEAAEAWRRHFADYRVRPLFEQLGEAWRLPEELREETELADFKGHLLEAFALRGRAGKLGWTRGPGEDGGIFSVYEKYFPSLGLTAALEFTGNSLPEENRTVALIALAFKRGGRNLMLREVPAVLLSECRKDLAALAAQGSGFDPDWEKKTPW